jgi:hypothetical protein
MSQSAWGARLRSVCVRWMLVSVFAALPVHAADNEVSELLHEADTAYEKGHLRLATTRLQQAINLLRDLEYTRAKALFPAPFKGWVSDNDNDALEEFRSLGIGSLFVTAQAYRRGDETLRIMLLQKPSTTHPLFGMLIASLEATVESGKKVPVGDYTGRIACPGTTAEQCHVFVTVNNDYVLYADGKKMTQEDILAYVRAMPLHKIEAFR